MSMLNSFKYLKFSLKEILIQFNRRSKLRNKNWVGRHVFLSQDLEIGTDCSIRDYAVLGEAVRLGDDVIIGSNARIAHITVGSHSHIESGVITTGNGAGKISIGMHCYIGTNNVLDWSESITIGDFVHIAGPATGIWTHSSALMCQNSIPLKEADLMNRPVQPIVIESNVYIGGGCIIYPGVKIGKQAIVSPGSVVTKDVAPFTLVGGVPAVKIKSLEHE